MTHRRRVGTRILGVGVASAVALATAGLAAAASAASAAPLYGEQQNVKISSFDGTLINVNFYPAKGLRVGQTAPTVLEGSGWDLPAYPNWLGTVSSIGLGSLSIGAELLGPATLTAHGYNVVTWDARGWYQSGGQVNVDSPSVEGRDVSAIIS